MEQNMITDAPKPSGENIVTQNETTSYPKKILIFFREINLLF